MIITKRERLELIRSDLILWALRARTCETFGERHAARLVCVAIMAEAREVLASSTAAERAAGQLVEVNFQ